MLNQAYDTNSKPTKPPSPSTTGIVPPMAPLVANGIVVPGSIPGGKTGINQPTQQNPQNPKQGIGSDFFISTVLPKLHKAAVNVLGRRAKINWGWIGLHATRPRPP